MMLVVAGENIIDLINIKDNAFQAFTGGAAFNVARVAAKLGASTGYLSPLSTDNFGQLFAAEIAQYGIIELYPRSSNPSGLAVVHYVDEQPTYTFYRDQAADRIINSITLNTVMPVADIFYIGGLALTGEQEAPIWSSFIQQVNCPIFIDPNIRPSFIYHRKSYLNRLASVYQVAWCIKLSAEDIMWLSPKELPEDYLRRIMKTYDIKLGLITFGSAGALAIYDNCCFSVPAPVVTVMDTVGAGDCFSATILATLLESGDLNHISDEALKRALEKAIIASAITCQHKGAYVPTGCEIAYFKANNLNQ
ncbi:MAG: PfkB family carbohydrate kinase [Ostreibacterium sp.]